MIAKGPVLTPLPPLLLWSLKAAHFSLTDIEVYKGTLYLHFLSAIGNYLTIFKAKGFLKILSAAPHDLV